MPRGKLQNSCLHLDDLAEVFANRAICQNSLDGPSFDLYFHSGFYFLLFSVRRTRSFF